MTDCFLVLFWRKLAFIVVASIFAFAVIIEQSGATIAGIEQSGVTTTGVCEDKEAVGICVGTGAKCTLKKSIFSFECGKDPEGDSITIILE